MLRTLFLIILGIAIGYFIGFSDGRKNDANVVERLVNRTGGGLRDSLRNDVDARVERSNR